MITKNSCEFCSRGLQHQGKGRVARAVAGAFALMCVASGVARAQQETIGFRADVDLVLLHVAVIDPRGREVPLLSAEDFTVFDDGAKQGLDLFVTPSDAPLDVAMVLDSSGSMKPVEMSARRAAVTFLSRLAPDDCVFVLPFSDRPESGRWGRAGDPTLHGYINSIEVSGGTALHDAILEGLARLERANANDLVAMANEAEDGPGDSEPQPPQPTVETVGPQEPPPSVAGMTLPPRRTSLLSQVGNVIRDLDLNSPPPVRGCGEPLPPGTLTTSSNARRKALIVVSDGADMDSDAGFYDALGAARAASVPVFPVAMGFANDDPRLKNDLEELARATGGRLIENTRPGELGAAYDEVVALLRSYYLLGYRPQFADGRLVPASDGRPRWHDVRVDLRRPNFTALVRPGYFR